MRRLKPPSIAYVLRKRKKKASKLLSAERKRMARWVWLGRKGYLYARNKYYLLHIADLPCTWCGSREERVCDHKLPRALGGSHALANLQVLCKKCHKRKTRWDMRYIREFRKTGRRTYTEPSESIVNGHKANT